MLFRSIYRLALRALDLEAQMQKHDCLAWHNEGVGCANCVNTIYPDAKSLRDAKTCETCRFAGRYGEESNRGCEHPAMIHLNDYDGVGHITTVPMYVDGKLFGCRAHEPKETS